MVGVGELAHHSWKGLEGHLSDQQVEEELLHLVVMEVVMGMMMIMEGVIDHLPEGEMEKNGGDGGDDGDGSGGDDSPPPSDQAQP